MNNQERSVGFDWPALLETALDVGMSVDYFWSLTPKETRMEFKARKKKIKREQDQAAWLAWHIAALSRAKRVPSFSKMVPPPKAKRLTPEEQAARQAEHDDMARRMARSSSRRRRVNKKGRKHGRK